MMRAIRRQFCVTLDISHALYLALFMVCLGSSSVAVASDVPEYAPTKRLAEQGNAKVQYNYGLLYEHGSAVKQDNHIAKAWFAKACDGECQHACDSCKSLILNES